MRFHRATIDSISNNCKEFIRLELNRGVFRFFSGLAVLLLAVYIVLIPIPRGNNHLLVSDGAYYYMYMRSLVLDRDADIDNDVRLYNSRMSEDKPWRVETSYVFSIGPAVLWSPFFITSHLIARSLQGAGMQIETDGFGYLEEATVSLAGILYVIVGLVLLNRVLSRWFPKELSLFSVVSMLFASSMIYYTLFEPSMSHTLEFFTVSLFLWTLYRPVNTSKYGFFAVGIAAGLLVIVRWQNAVVVATLLPALLLSKNSTEDFPQFLKRTMGAVFLFSQGFLPIILLQLLFWRAVFGQYVLVPQGSGFLTFTEPHIIEVLFSTRHGLFSWTPIALIGFVGLFYIGDRRIAIAFVLGFLLDLYISSIAGDWWGGDAYGMRRMIGILPLLTVGLASLLERFDRSKARPTMIGIVSILVIWNLVFVLQFKLGLVPHQDNLTLAEMTVDKAAIPVKLIQRLSK